MKLIGDSIFKLLSKQDKTVDESKLKAVFKPLFANLKGTQYLANLLKIYCQIH